jgi:hypothetical protein
MAKMKISITWRWTMFYSIESMQFISFYFLLNLLPEHEYLVDGIVVVVVVVAAVVVAVVVAIFDDDVVDATVA